jgi:hypothetical protein
MAFENGVVFPYTIGTDNIMNITFNYTISSGC